MLTYNFEVKEYVEVRNDTKSKSLPGVSTPGREISVFQINVTTDGWKSNVKLGEIEADFYMYSTCNLISS